VSIGAHTGAVVEHLLRSKPHSEQGYRACLGLLNLSREYGETRLEAASALAVRLGSPTRKSVKSILESGRDLCRSEPLDLELPAHGNVRGPGHRPPQWPHDGRLPNAISKSLNRKPESAPTSEITASCYRMLLHGKRDDPDTREVPLRQTETPPENACK
jgi:hypothetical protein